MAAARKGNAKREDLAAALASWNAETPVPADVRQQAHRDLDAVGLTSETGPKQLTRDVEFLPMLVARFPQLGRDYECHLADNGDSLSHVFFWDVTTAVMHAYNGTDAHYAELDWRGLLLYLEETYPTASPYVQGVIGTSFLFSLPCPAEAGYGIVAELGPVLTATFRQVRPSG